MAKRNGVWKIFTILGILIIAILLCYLSVALYFYFGKPNDIATKLKVWNLMSDQSIGDIYLDASFRVTDGDNAFYGVNVDENGYVVTLASEVDKDGDYKLYQNNGLIYGGKVAFSDKDLNIALLKLYSLKNKEENLSLPYVEIGDLYSSSISFNSSFIVVGDPLSQNNILTVNNVTMYPYVDETIKLVDGKQVVEFVNTSPYYYSVENYTIYSQGGIFNRKGEFLGLVYDYTVSSVNSNVANFFILDAGVIDLVLDNVRNSDEYQNNLVESLVGYDMYELQSYLDYPLNSSSNYIYFNEKWTEVPQDALTKFYNGADGVYLVEDFVYNDFTIPANNFITSVNYNLFSYSIYTKADLLYILYSAEPGEILTITSQNISTSEIVRTRITVE